MDSVNPSASALAAYARRGDSRFRRSSTFCRSVDMRAASVREADAMLANVAPVTKATPPFADVTLNLNVLPVGATRVQAPSPSWTANQSGVSPAVQNSHVVLPVPPVTA